ncbi:ATP-binding response regulator [Aureliella helgolandensis]|uniref:Regulatory protein LuxO n=1 Tax=Aureliella helgolandensis TaxID=2527968 RepID=A0A518FZY7_9BACT|nr:response regulator [Aureliella helgolandensis]QDV21927.1 Regulatory protein LuxO [Aureliella helgolandensis]
MPMILVADDSELDRMVIQEMLKKEPLDWLVEVVGSAEEAIALMREMAFDLVVTDVLMPGMSGIDLLNHVHRQPCRVPVIVISGQDDKSSAVEALRQGAASYVPKSELGSRLGETVKQVLDAARSEQGYQNLIGCANEMRYQFTFENDSNLIQPFIRLMQQMAGGMGLLCPEALTRFGIAIDEAMVNAMCHGNLELSQDEMVEVRSQLHTGARIEVMEQRRQSPEFVDRRLHVAAGLSKEGIKVTIRDDGGGFPVSDAQHSGAHRGITIIENLVDKASYNSSGNELTLVKLREVSKSRQAAKQPA